MGNRKGKPKPARFAALALVLGLSTAASAQTAQEFFDKGVEATRSGQTESALGYFRQAQEAGLRSGALFYNLGVTHYRLGQYAAARTAFERLTDHPTLGALAWYNLGLIARKLGHTEKALEAFAEARERTSDEKLRRLAASKIRELQGAERPARFSGAVFARAGRDDALQDPAEQVAQETDDQFAELFALGSGTVAGSPGDGWRLDLSAYALRYATFDDFDVGLLSLAAIRIVPAGSWRLEFGAGAEQSTLGGESYLREGRARFTARLPEVSGSTGYRLRYGYRSIESLDSVFDPQEGSRHDLDLEARWVGQPGRVALMYGLEVNDREDFAAPGAFTSYSPTRHALGVRASTELGRWRWNGELEYRHSVYADPNLLADGRRVKREDDRARVVVGVDYQLGKGWQIGAEYSRTENDSNIDDYDYEQNLVSAGVTAFF